MYSILIIGCGSIGERHLRCFQQTGRTRITACDVSPTLLAKLAKTYQVATAPDWEQADRNNRLKRNDRTTQR